MVKVNEREELVVRIFVALICGVIFYVWLFLIGVLILAQWILILVRGKRDKGIGDFCEYWNSEVYLFLGICLDALMFGRFRLGR